MDARSPEDVGDRLDRAPLGRGGGVSLPRRAPGKVRALDHGGGFRRRPLAAQPELLDVADLFGGGRPGAGRTRDVDARDRRARDGPRRRQLRQPPPHHLALPRVGRGARESLRRDGEGFMTTAYTSPFAERYSSGEMLYTFSPDKRYKTWRRLWIVLAEEEKKLGLKRITDDAIREMKEHADDIDYDAARKWEEKLKHDVMAHIRAYEGECPKAKGIIHLGATSMYVVDNTDLILMRDGLALLERELANVIAALAGFAKKQADVPTVAFTHFQPAQFTTVGKRACLWLYDLLLDLDEISERRKSLRFLGVKGTTGTQASFLSLFDGDEAKVKKLDQMVAAAMGFSRTYSVSGQTYSRKIDAQAQATLSGVAQSAHKFANDLRLLQHLREIQEPFDE